MATAQRNGSRPLCASPHEDDGRNPRYDELADRRESRGKPSRKDRQLCKQILRALEHAVRARAADPLLRDAAIEAVEPAPDAARLRVLVGGTSGSVAARLRELRGSLRAEIAEAITRKRVPELVFELAPPRPEAEEGGDA